MRITLIFLDFLTSIVGRPITVTSAPLGWPLFIICRFRNLRRIFHRSYRRSLFQNVRMRLLRGFNVIIFLRIRIILLQNRLVIWLKNSSLCQWTKVYFSTLYISLQYLISCSSWYLFLTFQSTSPFEIFGLGKEPFLLSHFLSTAKTPQVMFHGHHTNYYYHCLQWQAL